MGNFYANIALRTDDVDGVAQALTALRSDAWIAQDARVTMVFDRQCDDQDTEALERLSVALSQALSCAALAACNHDDDVLLLLSVDAGEIVDRYESTPGFFHGRQRDPKGGNAHWLCQAFGASEREEQVADVLRARHDDVGLEIDRHRSLQRLLGLPETMSFLGYRYVARGELATDSAASSLRKIDHPAHDERPSGTVSPALDPEYTRGVAALKAEEKDLFWNAYALALADAKVHERFVPLLGVAEGNGQVLFRRLRDYVVANKLVGPGGWIRADDLLTEFLGEREFHHAALNRLLREALHIPPLSTEQISAFGRGDAELLQRIARGFEAVERDANPSAFVDPIDDGG
jgi:hypothetical protein